MLITGGMNISGSMTASDLFPIATANTSTFTQTLLTGTAVTFTPFLSVTAGNGAYTYSANTTLPAGLTLYSGNGVVMGTPTTAGNTSVTFRVADAAGTLASNTVPINFSISVPPYTIQYLIVGGGGAGGTAQPGGSGGGGGGGLVIGSATVTGGTSYTIVVGSGGNYSIVGTGSKSYFTGGSIGNIIALGGGYGGAYAGGFPVVAGDGGSGGGGGGGSLGGGTGLQPFQPAIANATYYGNPGGPGGSNFGGGGGGAGATGNPAPGGAGQLWPYTGSYYAGGGGGSNPSLGSVGVGGSGGGGKGGSGTLNAAVNGTANTGGGGGGGGQGGSATPGSGGSGVIILAVPTPNYPGGYSGQASNPPAAPGMTVLTFNGSNTYTA